MSINLYKKTSIFILGKSKKKKYAELPKPTKAVFRKACFESALSNIPVIQTTFFWKVRNVKINKTDFFMKTIYDERQCNNFVFFCRTL